MGRENCEEEIKCSVIIMYKSRLLIESNVVWYLINVAFDHTPLSVIASYWRKKDVTNMDMLLKIIP